MSTTLDLNLTLVTAMPPTKCALDAPQRSLSEGEQLNGIYEIERLIGAGGMGEIYRAHEIETKHPVAIKLMLPEFAKNATALALFRKEASSLRHLQHEAIVRYYAFTVAPVLQRPYLAMEYVEGRSLAKLLHDDGPLPLQSGHALLQRVASGLHAAHERGVVHRDVSPANIIIPNDDVALTKILDFGIARSTQNNDTTILANGFSGKINYASPEQLGLFGAKVTPRSDIYSLGLVLVEALTGQPLDMGGTMAETIEKRRRLPNLAAIDLRIRPLIEQMLQPDPDQRPQSMAVVASWPIDTSVPAHGNSAGRTGSAARAGASRRKRRSVALLGMLAILGMCVGSVLLPERDNGNAGVQTKEPERVASPGKVRQYAETYDGGECFFVSPVAIRSSAAQLDVYSSSAQTLDRFARNFRNDVGFGPSIGMRLVNPMQCPVIDFLAALPRSAGRAPRLALDQYSVAPGEIVTGTIENGDNAELLFVADNGAVTDVSRRLTQTVAARTFRIDALKVGATTGQPQVLITIAGSQLPEANPSFRPMKAEQLFPELLRSAKAAGQTVAATARHFKLTQ